MDFKQIECFIEVVGRKSFSKAAEALYMSQPAVTSNVQKLEAELGADLLVRGGKGARPTKQGEIMLKYALELLKLRARAYCELKDCRESEEQKLEIAASSIPQEYLLPNYLVNFKTLRPSLSCQIHHGDSKEVIDMIVSGRLNLGFSGVKVEREDLGYRVLAEDKQVMIASAASDFKPKLKLGELKNQDAIFREEGSGTRKFFEDTAKKAGLGISMFKSVTISSSQNTIKRMVEAGLGISFISELAIREELRSKTLKAYDIEELAVNRSLYFVWTETRFLSPIETAFKSFILGEDDL